jgi:hypothetical protein
MLKTLDPGCLAFNHGPDRAQVQGPPSTASLTTVIGRRPTTTTAAPSPCPCSGPHTSHQQLLVLVELDVLDDRLLDPQQDAP